MDSRDGSRQQPQGTRIMTPSLPYGYHPQQQHLQNNPLANYNSTIIPNPTYAFNSMPAQYDAGLIGQQQQNGSLSGVAAASAQDAESGKRRRGRPRKYANDDTGLGFSSNSQAVCAAAGGSGSGQRELGEVNGEGSQGRRQRGRPPGSGKKQLDAIGGASGTGFTPHVIEILPNEDIVLKMKEFCLEGPRTIIILSAFGAVSNATIQLPGSADESGTVCYEGFHSLLSLSGPFFSTNYDGSRSNNFELTVILSLSDCKSSGGKVVGKLIAATAVQIIAASFISELKKSNGSIPPVSSPLPTPVSHMLGFGGSSSGNGRTFPLEGATDSSDDNGASGSHTLSHKHRPFITNYHMPSMTMYQPTMGWGNSGMGDMHYNSNG